MVGVEGWNSGKNLLPSWAWQDEGPPWPPVSSSSVTMVVTMVTTEPSVHGRETCHLILGSCFLISSPAYKGHSEDVPFGAWPKIVGRG